MSDIVKGDMLVKLYDLPDHRPLLDKLDRVKTKYGMMEDEDGL